jgi:hypothetical protein
MWISEYFVFLYAYQPILFFIVLKYLYMYVLVISKNGDDQLTILDDDFPINLKFYKNRKQNYEHTLNLYFKVQKIEVSFHQDSK